MRGRIGSRELESGAGGRTAFAFFEGGRLRSAHPSVLWLLLLLVWPGGSGWAGVETLEREAMEAHPDLAALDAAVTAARSRDEAAGRWPDPAVALEYSQVPVTGLDLSGHPMSGVQVKLMGSVPLSRSYAAEQDLSGLRVDEAAAARRWRGLEIRAGVREAWWALARARQLAGVDERHLERAGALREAVQARYETGTTGQHALLAVYVLEDRLRDDLDEVRSRASVLEARLLEAAGRDAGDPVDLPAHTEALPPPPGVEDWPETAPDGHPQVAVFAAEVRALRAAAALASARRIPELDLWGGYRVRTVETASDPGTDLVSLGVSVPLGISRGARQTAEAAALEATARGAAARLRRLEQELRARRVAVSTRWSRAWRRVESHRALVADARDALDAALASYRVGRADFETLYRAEVTLLSLERSAIEAANETRIQAARALVALGREPGGTGGGGTAEEE